MLSGSHELFFGFPTWFPSVDVWAALRSIMELGAAGYAAAGAAAAGGVGVGLFGYNRGNYMMDQKQLGLDWSWIVSGLDFGLEFFLK